MPVLSVIYCACLAFLSLLFACTAASAQPSTSTPITIGLYDAHGRVKPARLAREYTLLDCMNRGPEGVQLVPGNGLEYHKKDKMYYFRLTAIYAPFILKICHLNDTMELIVPQRYLAISRLKFRPGRYSILGSYPRDRVKLTKRGSYAPIYNELRHIDWDAAQKRYDSFVTKRYTD